MAKIRYEKWISVLFVVLVVLLLWCGGGVSCKQDPLTFTISFDRNGDMVEGEMDSQIGKANTEIVLTPNAYTLKGYLFDSWNTSADGSGEVYEDMTSIVVNTNLTLYAQWKACTYSISLDYDLDGVNVNCSASSYQTSMDECVVTLSASADNGYSLVFWDIEGDNESAYIEENLLIIPEGSSGDIVLSPVFDANHYIIKYDGNGSLGGSMEDQEFIYGVPTSLTANSFFRTSLYSFSGWNTEADGTGLAFVDRENVVFSSDTTLFAQWEIPYHPQKKESPTVFPEYVINNFSSFTDQNGRIVFSWSFVTESFDHIAIHIGSSDNSYSYDGQLTDSSITSFILEETKPGVIYSYSITPYLTSGEVGKVYSGTRYILHETYSQNLPTIYITTTSFEWPDCDYIEAPVGSMGNGITNNEYVPMEIRVIDGNGDELFYESTNKTRIKIRGNSSAYGDKKPYKIKLNQKFDLLAPLIGRTGAQFKDKEWLLLSSASSLNNVIGFAINNYLGIEYTPEYAFVELFMNGDYRGIYLLVESVKQGNTKGEMQARCAVLDDGFIIENDPYWWNEDVSFRTDIYHKNITFKYPDPDEIADGSVSVGYIEEYLNQFERALLLPGDGYLNYIDLDSFTSWSLLHEYLGSYDGAGSNQYMIKRDSTSNTKIQMTTAWDFDDIMREADINNPSSVLAWFFYCSALFEKESFLLSFESKYRQSRDGLIDAVKSSIDALPENGINNARENDSLRWLQSFNTIQEQEAHALSWLERRVEWMDKKYGE